MFGAKVNALSVAKNSPSVQGGGDRLKQMGPVRMDEAFDQIPEFTTCRRLLAIVNPPRRPADGGRGRSRREQPIEERGA